MFADFSSCRYVVVDIQGFNVGKEFVAKALAVVGPTGEVLDNFILKPPVPLYTVSPRTFDQQRYEEVNIHGIPWEEGTIPYATATQHLMKSLGRCKIIVVKGHQKEARLKEILPHKFKIQNIEPHGPKMQKSAHYFSFCINNAIEIRKFIKNVK